MGELTLAVLVSVPPAGAVTVKFKFVIWLFVSVPRLQTTALLLLTPPPLALTKLTPAGSASVTTTELAGDGPKFVTAIV